MADKYELLLKLENENPRWFVEIADDDERLVELRKAWKGEKVIFNQRHRQAARIDWDDEKIVELFKQGLSGMGVSREMHVNNNALHGYLKRKGTSIKEMRKKYATKKKK